MSRRIEIRSEAGGNKYIPLASYCPLLRMLLPLAAAIFTFVHSSAQQEPPVNNDQPGAAYVLPDQIVASERFDSLQLRLLEIEIRKAKLQVDQTGFWHRVIPRIQFSASFGLNDLLFVDPSNSLPYVFPRDAYRLTASVSITDIFDVAKHSNARLELAKIETEFERVRLQLATSKLAAQRQICMLDELIMILSEELNIREDIAAFDQLRFNQGKLGYDAMLDSKLDLLQARKNLLQLNQRKYEIQLEGKP